MTETDNVKVISRPKPKVRFHQFSTGDDTQNVEREVFEQAVKEQAVLRANGPRIREIVSLKKPVRIVDLRKQSTNAEKAIFMSNCNTDVSSRCDDIQNVSLSEKNMPRVEDMTTLCDVNAIWNTKKSCNKILQLDKSLRDDAVKVCAKSLGQKGKENKGIPLKRVISNKNVSETRTENFQQDMQSLTKEKFKLFTNTKNNCMQKVNVQNFKRPKMTKLQSAPSIVKKAKNCTNRGKIFNTKPSTSCFMSRYKTVVKNKTSPVKIVLRNVTGPKIKTSVGPGVFHKEQNTARTGDDASKRHVIKPDVPVQDLMQPEYNSIMCTINKLKELEQQKIVTAISHLPATLKTFLNGKISTALDFPLDETIYKNLIDLSIDEKQLPSSVMRSKDPEPQEKDMLPKLSNFFMPEDTKEVCEAVHVKSQAPKIDDNWNAFKISDRILEWRYSIDDIS